MDYDDGILRLFVYAFGDCLFVDYDIRFLQGVGLAEGGFSLF